MVNSPSSLKSDVWLILSSALSLILFSFRCYTPGVLFFTAAALLIVISSEFKPDVLLKTILASTLIMPSGGYFLEVKLWTFHGFPITPDKLLSFVLIGVLLIRLAGQLRV